jgi:hypothetical protein
LSQPSLSELHGLLWACVSSVMFVLSLPSPSAPPPPWILPFLISLRARHHIKLLPALSSEFRQSHPQRWPCHYPHLTAKGYQVLRGYSPVP